MFEDRNSTIDTINNLDIPKMFVSKATGFDPRKVTDFVKHRSIPEPDSARIKSAVEKIAYIWNVFAPYKVFFDSPELLQSAFEDAQITELNRESGLTTAKIQLHTATLDLHKMFSEMVSRS